MPVHRARAHHRHTGNMLSQRCTGGAVSLFNYNPSIAGGKVNMLRQGCGPHFRGTFHSKHKRVRGSQLPAEAAKAEVRTQVLHSNTAPTPSLKAADNRKKLMASFANHFASAQ